MTRSGLSMVDWKPLTGILPPLNDGAWANEFQKYKSFPEYREVNRDMTLDGYKFIYYWEYAHRILGRVLGLVFIIPFLIFWRQKKIPTGFTKKMIFAFALGGLQGFIGWVMVKSGLQDKPSVSHYRLALHLSLAYFIFCYFIWMILSIRQSTSRTHKVITKNDTESKEKKKFNFLLTLNQWLIALMSLQIIYGAFVAGLKAGYLYNTFPLMGSSFIPQGFWSMTPLWKNLFENPTSVQFIHRMLGYLLLIVGIFFTYWVCRHLKKDSIRPDSNRNDKIRRYALISLGLMFLQVFIGIFTLIFAVPVWLGVLHQANSLILLGSYTRLGYRLCCY